VNQAMHKLRFALTICAVAALAGCASGLAGNWQVRWPDGRQEILSIQDFGAGHWYLRGPAAELNGVYELKDAALTCVKPDLPTMGGFVWTAASHKTFTLIEQPEASRLHDHWLGATMTRVGPG
jgi:hypothetical protein